MPHPLGRLADLPDQRDHAFRLARVGAPAPTIPPWYRVPNYGIDDQGQLGSCVAHATEGAFRQLLAHEGMIDYVGSRLGVYYCARSIDGTTAIDGGTTNRSGIKAVVQFGVMPDALWPYDEARFAVKPPDPAYAAALKHVALEYQAVDSTDYNACCAAIFKNGNLIIGVQCYTSFDTNVTARNGKIPIPGMKEKLLGGHAMRAIGYTQQNLIVANSWGKYWGDFGLCYLPRAYVTNPILAGDFWTLVKN